MRKRFVKSREDGSQAAGRELVGLKPLHEQSTFTQMISSQRKKFAGKKIRDAGHPWMAGLADDDVVIRRRNAQVSAGVIDDHMQTRIIEGTIVDVLEIMRRGHGRGLKFDAFHRSHGRLQY